MVLTAVLYRRSGGDVTVLYVAKAKGRIKAGSARLSAILSGK